MLNQNYFIRLLSFFFIPPLFTTLSLSCSIKPKKEQYSLVMTIKLHDSLNDNAQPFSYADTFEAKSDLEAFKFGISIFSQRASGWDSTVFMRRIEPISFLVVNMKNQDVKNLIDKETIDQLEVRMWADITNDRNRMREIRRRNDQEREKLIDSFIKSTKNKSTQ